MLHIATSLYHITPNQSLYLERSLSIATTYLRSHIHHNINDSFYKPAPILNNMVRISSPSTWHTNLLPRLPLPYHPKYPD